MLENFRLKVFRAVAENLSFRKAGEKLYLSQPAVTLQIKALEDELGTTVFERSATGVKLSAAGKILLDYSERLSRLAEEADNKLANLKGEATGNIGSFDHTCSICASASSSRICPAVSCDSIADVQPEYREYCRRCSGQALWFGTDRRAAATAGCESGTLV
jgi:DNA-binding transcriptional LysR family regulator